MLTLDKVYHAAFKLKEVIRPTDLIHAPQINPDADVYLKTENLQVTGSFKVRGAYYKISTLTDEEKKHGGKSRSGCCSCGTEKRYQVDNMSAGRRSHFKGRGYKKLRCGDMSC